MNKEWLALFQEPTPQHIHFKGPLSFYPHHSKGMFIPLFYDQVYKDLMHLCSKPQTKYSNLNLSKQEKLVIKSLKNAEDIVIKQADKGGGIVILSRETYIQEVHRLLSDHCAYSPLASDLLATYKTKLLSIVDKALLNG